MRAHPRAAACEAFAASTVNVTVTGVPDVPDASMIARRLREAPPAAITEVMESCATGTPSDAASAAASTAL